MTQSKFSGQSKESDPGNNNPYGDWQDWAEEAFPDETPQRAPDKIKTRDRRYYRQQTRLESRRKKGVKDIAPRVVQPIVEVELEADPSSQQATAN